MTESQASISPGRLLLDPAFGPFFFGRLSSHLAVWIHNVAAAILIFDATGSAFSVGLVTVTQTLPQVFISSWGGSLSDRYDRRNLLIMGRVPAGLSCLVLAGVVLWGGASESMLVWTVYAVGLLSGIGWGIGLPAGHALVPAMVPRNGLSSAITLTSMTGNLSRAAGPAIAGMILFLGLDWLAFAVAGLGHIVFALVLLRLPIAGRTKAPTGSGGKISEGLRYVRDRDRLWVPLAMGVVAGLGVEPVLTLGPSLAVAFGRTVEGASILGTVFGLGAVVSVLGLGWVRRRVGLERTAFVGFSLLALSLLGVFLAPSFVVALAAIAVGGAGLMYTTASLQAWIQHLLDEQYRGRVMALWAIAYLGSRPLWATMLGLVADAFSARTGVGFAFVGCATAAWFILNRWRRWGRPATERLAPAT